MYRQAEAIRQASTPGRYEGLTAFDAWLCETALGDSSWWDDVAGDTDQYGVWGVRIGRRVLLVDSQGFHDVTRYQSEDKAEKTFGETFGDWYAWSEIEDWNSGYVGAEDLSDRARALLTSEGVFVDDGSEMVGRSVTVAGYRGIAWRITGHDKKTGQVQAVMVGDDRTFTFDVSEVSEIDRADYCGECGQIGCTHDGYDR